MLHRYGSLVVTALVLVAAASAAWHGLRNERRVAFFAAFLAPWLLLIQIVLGVMTVQSTIGVIEVVAHMGVGSLMLADLVVIYLALSPRRQAAEHAVDAVETPSMSRGHLQEATS